MFAVTVGVAIAALIMFLLISWVVQREKGLIGYFEKAAETYVWLEQDAARQAALAAAKAGSRGQRDRMVAFLTRLDSDLAEESVAPGEVRERACRLAQEVEAGDWTVEDGREAARDLETVDPDYAQALRRRNASVFQTRYPRLFKAATFESLVEAAEQERRNG